MKKVLYFALLMILIMPFSVINAKEIVIKEDIVNGIITADKSNPEEGETVTLTVTPNEGYQLKSIKAVDKFDEMPVTITNNTFLMPSYIVYISAEFEEIPGYSAPVNDGNNPNDNIDENDIVSTNENENNNNLLYVICGASLLLVVCVIAVVLNKKKKN